LAAHLPPADATTLAQEPGNEDEAVLGLGGMGANESGRSSTLLKVKRFQDLEARVLRHEEGAGRHKGRMGALVVEMADGIKFSVGTGFSDKERENPPAIGSLITVRFQELSEAGVPRFPSYVGVRVDASTSNVIPKGAVAMKNAPASKDVPTTAVRRFEFSDEKSHKFWEVAVQGVEVTVRFGRIGTQGQTQTKSFPDEAAALKHADKLIREKTGKGYRQVQ
jgi:DNA ligase 1